MVFTIHFEDGTTAKLLQTHHVDSAYVSGESICQYFEHEKPVKKIEYEIHPDVREIRMNLCSKNTCMIECIKHQEPTETPTALAENNNAVTVVTTPTVTTLPTPEHLVEETIQEHRGPQTLGDYYGVTSGSVDTSKMIGRPIFQYTPYNGVYIVTITEFGHVYELISYCGRIDNVSGFITEATMKDFLNIVQPLFVIRAGEMPICLLANDDLYDRLRDYRKKKLAPIIAQVDELLN